jgi:hypothetical protein
VGESCWALRLFFVIGIILAIKEISLLLCLFFCLFIFFIALHPHFVPISSLISKQPTLASFSSSHQRLTFFASFATSLPTAWLILITHFQVIFFHRLPPFIYVTLSILHVPLSIMHVPLSLTLALLFFV